MFKSISWLDFFVFTGVVIGGYYIVILLRYFGRDISHWIGRRANVPVMEEHLPDGGFPSDLMSIVHDLVDEVDAFFRAAGKGLSKEEILVKLSYILKKYPAVKGSILQESVDQLLRTQSNQFCDVNLEEEELAELWN